MVFPGRRSDVRDDLTEGFVPLQPRWEHDTSAWSDVGLTETPSSSARTDQPSLAMSAAMGGDARRLHERWTKAVVTTATPQPAAMHRVASATTQVPARSLPGAVPHAVRTRDEWLARCALDALDTGDLRPTVQTGVGADRLVEDVGDSLLVGGLRGIRRPCGGDERFWHTTPDRPQRWYQTNPPPGGGLGTNPHDQPVEASLLVQIGVTRSRNHLAVAHISYHMA